MQQVMKTVRVYGWIKEHEKKEQNMNNFAAENIEEDLYSCCEILYWTEAGLNTI